MKTRLFVIFILPLLLAQGAHAGILGKTCVKSDTLASTATTEIYYALLDQESSQGYGGDFVKVGAAPKNIVGLTCGDLKNIKETIFLVGVALAPAAYIMKNPILKSALASELAAMGLAVGSPAVLTATVIGSFGILTVNMLIERSLEECAKQEKESLKQEIIQDLEKVYGFKKTPQTTFQINR